LPPSLVEQVRKAFNPNADIIPYEHLPVCQLGVTATSDS
jgi:hypothetical protein